MRKLGRIAMGVLGLAGSALAQVEMNTAGTCAMGSDDLGVKYLNKTLDTWEMRGYSMSIGTGRVAGKFFEQSSGGYGVAPGGTGMIHFQSCGGNTGKVYSQQLEAKVGSCNEPDPPREPEAMVCAEVPANPPAAFYNAAQCLVDGLGINRGDGYGGFIDSWQGQSQIQAAIPTGTVNMGGTQVRFDPASMGGPFYMMSMAALQEYLYVDMQFLLAMGASTTGAGLVDASGTSLYQSPPNTGNDNSPYGSFKVTYLTATGRLYSDYPKYFAGSPDINKLVATGGAGPTLANSPQQLNSGFLAAMNLWWLFDGLKSAQDLCFRQYLKEATDKAAGLKLMLGGYHIGPNAVDNGTGEPKDYATHVLPTTNATLLGAADVTPYMKKFVWGGPSGPDYNTHNHITRTFSVLNQMTTANTQSAACGGSLPIYDAGITLQQVQELFFGQGGTAATQGNGGLLWHFNIPAASRQALWTELTCTFDKLKGKAPGRAPNEISYRYDFLTLLRVARSHFSGYVNKHADRPTPSSTYSSEWSIWVAARSKVPCTRSTQDLAWPALALTDTSLRKGDKVEKSATDNVGLKSREFTTDLAWRIWQPTDANFAVPMTLTGTQRLWYRVTDSCGNSTIQEVPWRDTPPLPILPPPTANPRGSNFFNTLPVTLTLPDSVKDAAIYFTTDGSNPTTASPRYTGPVPISSTAATGTVTLKAFAVKAGYQNSPFMIEIYTKVAMPVAQAPVLTPPSRTFTTLDPDFTVAITAAAGAVILYSTDGRDPDTVANARTFTYSTPIPVTTTLTIRALAKQVDHLPSPVVEGLYQENPAPKVATPVATPGASSFIQAPLSVTLTVSPATAAIMYSLNGGPATPYSGPLSLTATTTLKAWATLAGYLPSDTLTAVFTYTPPVGVRKAWYADRDGDGRIETVVIDFDKELAASPARLTFAITDARGMSETRDAAPTSMSRSGARVTVTLPDPFGFGITSMANAGSSGRLHKQDDIPLLDGSFAIDDSVAPVIVKAEVVEPDSGRLLKQVVVTFSEPVTFPAGSPDALAFKRDADEMAAGEVRFVGNATASGTTGWIFAIDSLSAKLPIVKDSVAINVNGQTKDVAGNTPSRKRFRVLEGNPPKAKPSKVYVTFPYGTMDAPKTLQPEPSTPPGVFFVPVGRDGSLLPGFQASGACPGCQVGGNDGFAGPIIFVEVPGAGTHEYRIFNNVGEFVAMGTVRLDEADLKSLEPIANGTLYRARIIWTGKTSKDSKAGTGAYILQAILKHDRNLRTGAPPATDTHRVKFGLLRNFRGL